LIQLMQTNACYLCSIKWHEACLFSALFLHKCILEVFFNLGIWWWKFDSSTEESQNLLLQFMILNIIF